MNRKIINRFTSQYRQCPCEGQWYATSRGHVMRVSLVDTESQKVVCELLGRDYTLSYPLIAFLSGRNFKRIGGAA
ncbi:hypothetical protein V6E22_15170 [Citrobacter freundii]|uniref:hypothetical protein n=1 Tax=Citrobacter freundii TaxID=546 RepID=UPI002FD89998